MDNQTSSSDERQLDNSQMARSIPGQSGQTDAAGACRLILAGHQRALFPV